MTAARTPTRRLTSTEDDFTPSVMPRIISGSIGSIITALAVTPLEVVKVRVQASRGTQATTLPPNVTLCPRGCGTFILNNGLMDCVLPKSAVPYFDQWGQLNEQARNNLERPNHRPSGTFGMIRRIFLREGMSGIYAGLRPTLVMSVPNTVVYFAGYDEIVSRLRSHRTGLGLSDWWVPLVSGASARTLASTLTAPLELVRTRQAAIEGASETAPGLLKEFRIIIRNEGTAALYQGLAPTLWRDVPFSAIYWLCLDRFKILWKKYDTSERTPLRTASQSFVDGAVAGLIAAFFTAPFDVAKTRRQTVTEALVHSEEDLACHHNGASVYKSSSTSSAPRAKGTVGLMKEIVSEEGISGLWRGNQARMMKVAPACAIMISCYEVGKQLLQ